MSLLNRLQMIFQSSLPTRGSDFFAFSISAIATFFNPRSPRGGATRGIYNNLRSEIFQSSLPTRGSDLPMGPTTSQIWRIFQSSLPTRGSDGSVPRPSAAHGYFSILAPHEGERLIPHGCRRAEFLFSILAPHEGERPSLGCAWVIHGRFQSSLPTRGSDYVPCKRLMVC